MSSERIDFNVCRKSKNLRNSRCYFACKPENLKETLCICDTRTESGVYKRGYGSFSKLTDLSEIVSFPHYNNRTNDTEFIPEKRTLLQKCLLNELKDVQEVHCYLQGGRLKTDKCNLNFECTEASIGIDPNAVGKKKNETKWITGPFIKDAAYERFLAYDPEFLQPLDTPTKPPTTRTSLKTARTSLLTPVHRDTPINNNINPYKYNHSYHEPIAIVLCGMLICLFIIVVAALVEMRRNYQRRNINRRNHHRHENETA